MIRLLTIFTSKRYRNICKLSRGFMQIRIRDLYRAAPETVQRATHAFAAPIENMG
jgi:ribosomal protein L20